MSPSTKRNNDLVGPCFVTADHDGEKMMMENQESPEAEKNENNNNKRRRKQQHQQQQQQQQQPDPASSSKARDDESGSGTSGSNNRRRRYKLLSTSHRRTNDEIHSTILFDCVTNAIIDTPVVQRLRGLKQLGVDELVYVNVNHTRFEHSLGVAHLAQKLCESIRTKQPQLGVSNKDVLCLKLAGLLHDTGHGPFSHTYEDFILHSLPEYIDKNPQLKNCYNDLLIEFDDEKERRPYRVNSTQISHEEMSLRLIDVALEHLGLQIDLDRLDAPLREIGSYGVEATSFRVGGYGGARDDDDDNDDDDDDDNDILTSRDFVFIKECILGKPIAELEERFGFEGFYGRTQPHLQWMYDIVSNSHNGLDVDKIDYYARDERRSMRASGEIDKVMIEEAVVAWADCNSKDCCKRKCRGGPNPGQQRQHLMICYPEKLVEASINFFKKRFELFTKIYMHKTCLAAQLMVRDILCYADPYLRIPSSKYQTGLPISYAMIDPSTFLVLRDDIIGHILLQTEPKYKKAQTLIRRFRSRDDLYKRVATKCINDNNEELWHLSKQEITSQMMEVHNDLENNNNNWVCDDDLHPDDFIIDKCHIHHGSKDQNPLLDMRFLPKSKLKDLTNKIEELPDAEVVDEERYEAHLPRSFQQRSIQVFSRVSDKFNPSKNKRIRQVFDLWWNNKETTTASKNVPRNDVDEQSVTIIGSHGIQMGEEETNGLVALTQETQEKEDTDDDGLSNDGDGDIELRSQAAMEDDGYLAHSN